VSHSTVASKGTTTTITVSLRNVGWARLFSKRPLVVTLRHKTTGATIARSGGNLSNVAAGATAQIAVSASIPSGAAAGDYEVQIGAPDVWSTTAGDPRFAVRFANANSGTQAWNSATGRFTSGTTLRVQ
jgi:sarcosine oxidase gamma subunit